MTGDASTLTALQWVGVLTVTPVKRFSGAEGGR
jgi:hypothetical protein